MTWRGVKSYIQITVLTEARSDINLLLMGKSGHGKSSTGNSILGRKEFAALGGGSSVTKEQQNGYTKVDGRTIKVVDIPGICDTDCSSDEEKINLVVSAISAGLRQFPQGFHALLLVLSYTVRITPEEETAIEALKMILGENVLRDHTIIVFTHGDSFKDNYEDKGVDFKTWCRQQKDYKHLFDECSWRCVLFDNSRSCTRDEKYSQLIDIIALVDSLRDVHNNFTMNKLVAAGEIREETKRISLILEKYSREIGLIKDALHKIMCSQEIDKLEKIKELKQQATKLLDDLSQEDHEKLTGITIQVQTVSSQIQSLEGMVIQQEQDKTNLQKAIDDMNTGHEKQIESMKSKEKEREHEMKQLHAKINSLIDASSDNLDSRSKQETGGIMEKIMKYTKDVAPILLQVAHLFTTMYRKRF